MNEPDFQRLRAKIMESSSLLDKPGLVGWWDDMNHAMDSDVLPYASQRHEQTSDPANFMVARATARPGTTREEAVMEVERIWNDFRYSTKLSPRRGYTVGHMENSVILQWILEVPVDLYLSGQIVIDLPESEANEELNSRQTYADS